MITFIQAIAPTAAQSYVEVNDMKHYYRGRKDERNG